MNVTDIVAIVVVSVAVLAALGVILYRKLKHKGGCCDCGNCSACGGCSHCKEDRAKNSQPRNRRAN